MILGNLSLENCEKDAIPDSMHEALTIICQLIHEIHVLGDGLFYKHSMDILPNDDEINPTFTCPDDDLNSLS